MNDNLAHKLPEPKGEMVQFPKKERQVMSDSKFNYVTGIRDIPMEKTTKHVAITLATYADYNTGICYPTIKTLMAATGLSNRAVCLHLGKLEELGFIVSRKADGRNSKYKFIAENIQKAVTESHHASKSSSDFDDIEAVTLTHEAVTLTTQSSDSGSHKQSLTTNNNQINSHTGEKAHENFDQEDSWKPNLNFLKTILFQTKFSNRAEEIISLADFNFHLGNFNAHWENKIDLTENQKTRKFAAWLIQEFEKQLNKIDRAEKQKTGYQPKPKVQQVPLIGSNKRRAERTVNTIDALEMKNV
ncbi:helix-turn-helix domain-containing protein [Acinetobacter cumulans]|uniref:Helix-turn-helix domain-containing protein n=1 Tax=Acinetobacter cumulans TaxID=2136182 RepID=A0ABX9U4F8_9GAMM|nr:helix-turn-helix domain-containing protein [Acinetobacter cumulans]RLL42965.1 helix-turn-helix domain-containing protein [Acinetobacter cumulans]